MAKGNFIEYVISDDPNKYPNGSEQDGYYYRKVIKFETEEQTVTAGTTPIEVIPSAGKLISKVNINPTPTEEKTVTPTTEDLIVAPVEGKYFSQFTVKGDANLVSENIKNGVDIFGIIGTYEGGEGQYAWKKQEKTIGTKSFSFTITVTSTGGNCTISCQSGLSVSELVFNDLVGVSIYGTGGRMVFSDKYAESGGATYGNLYFYYDNGNTNTASYNYVDGSSTINIGGSGPTYIDSLSLANQSGNGSKSKEAITEVTIGYVVSDDSNAYPTDGSQHTDGYYYNSISQ